MKIIGQSTIVTTPPYLHLGYLATTVVHYTKPLFSAGLVLIVVGLLLTCVVKRDSKLQFAIKNITSLKTKVSGFTAFCLILGCLLVLVYFYPYKSEYAMPGRLTNARLTLLHRSVMDSYSAGASMADSLNALDQQDSEFIRDAWGTEMRIEPLARNDPETIRVISAGPDTQFDTPDDLVYPPDKG